MRDEHQEAPVQEAAAAEERSVAMMMTSPENSDRDAQESAFFRDVDSIIADRFQDHDHSQVAKKRLQERTKIEDNKLIEELTRLGVEEDTLGAMRAVPLVMVAWASGRVAPAEQQIVMSQATSLGIRAGSIAAALVKHWLGRKPPLLIVDAYIRYIHAEFAKISEHNKEERITQIEQQMMAIAKACGGHFGFGRVSAKEQQMIDMMTRHLRG